MFFPLLPRLVVTLAQHSYFFCFVFFSFSRSSTTPGLQKLISLCTLFSLCFVLSGSEIFFLNVFKSFLFLSNLNLHQINQTNLAHLFQNIPLELLLWKMYFILFEIFFFTDERKISEKKWNQTLDAILLSPTAAIRIKAYNE